MRSWALCHMLLCNPNYATRFRALGDSYVTQGRDSFDSAFAPVAKEMAFEYAFFLEHMDVGYRVDLCRWDWQKRFHTLDARGTASARIEAARGYQASGLTVVAGQHYDYATIGSWGTSAEEPSTNADGDARGTGRMVAVVLDAYRLGEPFDLGNQGTFRSLEQRQPVRPLPRRLESSCTTTTARSKCVSRGQQRPAAEKTSSKDRHAGPNSATFARK